jgi:hypothetical protein
MYRLLLCQLPYVWSVMCCVVRLDLEAILRFKVIFSKTVA